MSSTLAGGEISLGISYTTELLVNANAKRKKPQGPSVKMLRSNDRLGPLYPG